MVMRPFFCYYGGKWRAAPKYPAPTHRRIIEPFAGAAGYSVRHADRDVVLCDKDPTICALWRYLIRATPEDILRLPDVKTTVAEIDLGPEPSALIGFWLNKGVATPRNSPSSWMRSGIRPGSFWGPEVRRRIAAQVERINHWAVVEGDYLDLSGAGPATWFVDPPYAQAGIHYRHGSSAIDFEALGTWVRLLPGQVIACENEGAEWLPFQPFESAKTARKGRRSAEVIWSKAA